MGAEARLAVMMSSASPEWYTPPWLLERVGAFLGAGWHDPCPPSYGMPSRDGLAAPWRGRLYCNPPYGRAIGAWTRKALADPLDEIVLLVPARTDTRWFQPLFAHHICFIRGRLRFSGCENGAPFPSALVYIGSRGAAFRSAFSDLGPIVSEKGGGDGR